MSSDLTFKVEISEDEVKKRLSKSESYIRNNCPYCTFDKLGWGKPWKRELHDNKYFEAHLEKGKDQGEINIL